MAKVWCFFMNCRCVDLISINKIVEYFAKKSLGKGLNIFILNEIL